MDIKKIVLIPLLPLLLCGCPDTPPPTENIGMSPMVEVEGGTFVMGDQTRVGDLDEQPAHVVTLAKFSIGKFEVTFNEYVVFCKDTQRTVPSDNGYGRAQHPVINVSRIDALAYCEWLSGKTGKTYTLPTEAQWEYAARAGAVTLYTHGNNPDHICKTANVADQSAAVVEPQWQISACSDNQIYTANVGSLSPNAFGLYDMQGNVWEWTSDCYLSSYRNAPENGIQEPDEQCEEGVIRGGSFQLPAHSSRLSNREAFSVTATSKQIGFRLVSNP